MDFKATFTDSPAAARGQCRAESLAELLVSIALSSLLLLVVAAFSITHSKSFAALSEHMEMDQANRSALDLMTKDFRKVAGLTAYQTNSLTFNDSDGQPLRYVYDPARQTLTREKNGRSTVLLRQCHSLTFTMLQRNMVGGTFNYYTTTSPGLCKVVAVDWSCYRNTFGKKAPLTTSQYARVVIRNK